MHTASVVSNLRVMRSTNARILPSPWHRYSFSSHTGEMAHLIQEAIDEELLPGNRLQYFHPTKPGDILDGKFKTLVKLVFGTGSTVWLAENVKFKRWKRSSGLRYVSVKIAALDTDSTKEAKYSSIICHATDSHEGLTFLRIPFHQFQLKGPGGLHSCLVYEPMRETLFQMQHRFKRQRLSLPLFKFFIYCLLQALDYLHAECRIIHTDIKEDNIMATMENDDVLKRFVAFHSKHAHPRHERDDGRVVYLSQDDFGPLQGTKLLPELGDFNLCYPGLKEGTGHISAVQSHRYRAPEVFLGCPWSYSADIWNLGLLMWNLLEDTSLFGCPAGKDGEYNAHVHLAQMVSLLGHPPPAVIERERMCRDHRLQRPVIGRDGNECFNMNEYWGGPFFDENGKLIRQDLLKSERLLADTITEITGKDKEQFLDLASGMLDWLPEKRKSAKELMSHPFFDSFHQDRRRHE